MWMVPQVHKGFLRAFTSVTDSTNATYNIASIWEKLTGVAPTSVTSCAPPTLTRTAPQQSLSCHLECGAAYLPLNHRHDDFGWLPWTHMAMQQCTKFDKAPRNSALCIPRTSVLAGGWQAECHS